MFVSHLTQEDVQRSSLFTSGLGWNRCGGVPQFAVHPRKEWLHTPGWSVAGTGGRLQAQGQCHVAL